MLDPRKAVRRMAMLSRYIDVRHRKLLELGSGYGINLIVWAKHFAVDAFGVEPESEGFSSTVEISKTLCRLNGIDPERVFRARGESLPFPDNSFDVVYSANVLEH